MGGVSQPSGTLVCGNLRRAAQEVTMANQAALQDTLAENSMMSSNQSWQPSSPGNSSRPSVHGGSARQSSLLAAKTATPSKSTRRSMVQRQDDTSTKQDWMSMYLVDAIEALISA